jgi:hypothetical protein
MKSTVHLVPWKLALAATYLLTAKIPTAVAAWPDEIGLTKLQAELGANMPDGTGVTISQIESENGAAEDYAPVVGSGTVAGTGKFQGISFVLKSGASNATFHASEVGSQLYGMQGFPGARFGAATAISLVDCYGVNDWLATGFLSPAGGGQPSSELRQLQNHSWAGGTPGSASQNTAYNDYLRRFDWVITNSNTLAVVGTSNDSNAPIPILLTSAYNALSVGLTDATHARGLTVTATNIDGPGRIKPDMVAPLDFSSYSSCGRLPMA